MHLRRKHTVCLVVDWIEKKVAYIKINLTDVTLPNIVRHKGRQITLEDARTSRNANAG